MSRAMFGAMGKAARLRCMAASALIVGLMPGAVSAQQTRSLAPAGQQFAPSGGAGALAPGQTLVPPGAMPSTIPGGPPLAAPSAAIPAGLVGLVVGARYGRDFP